MALPRERTSRASSGDARPLKPFLVHLIAHPCRVGQGEPAGLGGNGCCHGEVPPLKPPWRRIALNFENGDSPMPATRCALATRPMPLVRVCGVNTRLCARAAYATRRKSVNPP